jgi:hypothetical protein
MDCCLYIYNNIYILCMYKFFFFGVIYFLYKILLYIYYVYTFNIDELIEYRKNSTNKTIFAIYGHTSMFDVPYLAWTGIRSQNIVVLAKKKYKWMYPKLCHKYIHFIEKNTSKIQFNKDGAVLIEGTRSKEEYIRSGYKYISKNNNAVIVYWINNYKYNKIQLSSPIDYNENNEIILEHLKKFIEKKSKSDYSIYPKKLSEIKFKI